MFGSAGKTVQLVRSRCGVRTAQRAVALSQCFAPKPHFWLAKKVSSDAGSNSRSSLSRAVFYLKGTQQKNQHAQKYFPAASFQVPCRVSGSNREHLHYGSDALLNSATRATNLESVSRKFDIIPPKNRAVHHNMKCRTPPVSPSPGELVLAHSTKWRPLLGKSQGGRH